MPTTKKQKQTKQASELSVERKFTDNAASRRFIDNYKNEFRFVYTWQKWLYWDGRRWNLSRGENKINESARLFADTAWTDAELQCQSRSPHADAAVKFAGRVNQKERIKAIVELAKSDQRVAIDHDRLDADPYLLNVQNGTFDLRTIDFCDHRPGDLLTQIANVDYLPGADCPLWLDTLDHIFDGDADLIKYLQTLLGYSLAGITDEHILPICYGEGNNGKSTVWNTFAEMLGGYAWQADRGLLLVQKNQQHKTALASLFGRRFVTVSEPDEGCKLAEAKVKELTGDKIVNCRRCFEDEWLFTPTHTFWLSTNHKPQISGTDTGIWRRIKLIPFKVELSEVLAIDKQFPEKLKAEFSGILNWALEGWRRYQLEGLVDPQSVIDATAEYRADEDTFGDFLRQTYIENSSFVLRADAAFKAYQEWGGKMTKTKFGKEMSRRYRKEKHTAGEHRDRMVYHGIGTLD